MATRRLPPLRALEAFVRTVRLGSARAAADELGLSPSALSRRIGNLEDFVGKKLFTRARQSMQLTDDGHAFFEAVNPQLEALARAVESQSENLSVLRLHLGVLPLFGTQRLFPARGTARAASAAAYRHRHGGASRGSRGRRSRCRDHPFARAVARTACGAAGLQQGARDLQPRTGGEARLRTRSGGAVAADL